MSENGKEVYYILSITEDGELTPDSAESLDAVWELLDSWYLDKLDELRHDMIDGKLRVIHGREVNLHMIVHRASDIVAADGYTEPVIHHQEGNLAY